MYITWFCYIWRVVVLSFIPSAPKLVNFHHFWVPGVEKKHVYIHIYLYIICKYVHMYITWFCYIWRVVVLSFIPSTPKLVNFANFLESRSWGKNMSTPKLVNFPSFGFQELRKTCIYIYTYIIYIICKYVHMYITWFYYIWRVVILSFIPSIPKLANFPFFWIPRIEKKYIYMYMLIISNNFPAFYG